MSARGLAGGVVVVVAGFVAGRLPHAAEAPQTVFRATADAISVPLAVTRDGEPVADLAVDRFAVFDNGVMQEVRLMAVGARPIDVTLVLDTSGSVSGAALAQLRADIETIVGLLEPTDRVRVLTFAGRVHELRPLEAAAIPLDLRRVAAGGATALHHGIVSALLPRADPARPHVVVALGDGTDNVSWLDATVVRNVAERSEMVLHVLVRDRWTGGRVSSSGLSAYGWVPFGGPGQLDLLDEAATATGGTLRHVRGAEPVADEFARTIRDFKTSYLLWFEPTGVDAPGWHEIVVRIRGGSYQVRARRGYFGG